MRWGDRCTSRLLVNDLVCGAGRTNYLADLRGLRITRLLNLVGTLLGEANAKHAENVAIERLDVHCTATTVSPVFYHITPPDPSIA